MPDLEFFTVSLLQKYDQSIIRIKEIFFIFVRRKLFSKVQVCHEKIPSYVLNCTVKYGTLILVK